MKKYFNFVPSSLIALAALWSLTGCGRSPILHHITAAAVTNPIVVSENIPGNTGNSSQPNTTACSLRLAKSNLCVGFKWASAPATDQEMSATLTLTNEQGKAVDAPTDMPNLAVQLWMPSMGHGSSPVRVVRTELGTYAATGIYFIMPGQWEVRIQLKSGREVTDQTTFNVEL